MGSIDPEEHLDCFENVALLHQYSDEVKCWVFLTTLAGSTQWWFNQLPSNSIQSFEDFSILFLQHFANNKRYHKLVLSLFSMKQRSHKTLRDYV